MSQKLPPAPETQAPVVGGWRSVTGITPSRILPQTRLSGPMPWVIAIMIALTVVAAASALSLRNLARSASADLEGGLTVQVVEAAPAERTRQAQRALDMLRGAPGVAEARLVPQDELNRLIEPWLGTRAGDELDGLPIPALIDVRMNGPADPARVEAVRRALAQAAPAARVDAQASWLAPVFATIGALQWAAAGLIALLGFATSAAVLLAARAALGANRGTIEIMHMLGATDGQIARLFQRSIAQDAAAGGLAGLGVGIAAILLIGGQFAALGSGMMSEAGLGLWDWISLAIAPLAGVGLAVLTTRITVLRALGQML